MVLCSPVIAWTISPVTGVADMPATVIIMTEIRACYPVRAVRVSFIDRK